MKSIYEIQKEANSNIQKPNPLLLNEVLRGTYDSFLDAKALFAYYFDLIPNKITIHEIDCIEAYKWFFEKFSHEIWNVHFEKTDFNIDFQHIIFHVFDDLIIEFSCQYKTLTLLFNKTNNKIISTLVSDFQYFKSVNRKDKPKIYLITSDQRGIILSPITLKTNLIDIFENYNDDFPEVHQIISKKLIQKNTSGIILLHGIPGTGKTYYIRHLVSTTDKNVIFLPPNMASVITNPQFLNILVENPNSVFVIEDAEKIIIDRDLDGDSGVSALLNISDGLLSDFLNIQIICTFNTDIAKVDKALLRKGRLIAKYEFKKLEVNKAILLSHILGFDNAIHEPMSLTEIYNQTEKDFTEYDKMNAIGFLVN